MLRLAQGNFNATVAQSVEQLIRNQQVAGSSPASSSILKDFFGSPFNLSLKIDDDFLVINEKEGGNMILENKKILFLGDSITFGVGVSNPDNIYWRRLAINDGCITKGYGISGTRIAENLNPSIYPEDDGAYFVTRLPIMDDDADVIVVFGGTNDYGHGDAPLGTMADRVNTTFYGALHNLITALLEKYPRSKIVFMTPAHRCGEIKPADDFSPCNGGNLQDYVDVIIEVAVHYGLPVLDLYRVLDIDPNIPQMKERYIPDGLHPCDAGHEEIYRHLKAFLESV